MDRREAAVDLMRSASSDPARWAEAVEELSRGTATDLFGMRITEVADDHLVMTMPITRRAQQAVGLLHGGVTMMLAESASSVHASWGIDLSRVVPVGLEISGSHLRSAADGTARAIARVLRRSSVLIVHDVHVTHVETERLLSVARVTNFYKPVS